MSTSGTNWQLIYTTSLYTQAEIIKGKLEQNDIPVRMLNKQDSMYIVIGEIELYVPMHLKSLAIEIISEELKN